MTASICPCHEAVGTMFRKSSNFFPCCPSRIAGGSSSMSRLVDVAVLGTPQVLQACGGIVVAHHKHARQVRGARVLGCPYRETAVIIIASCEQSVEIGDWHERDVG